MKKYSLKRLKIYIQYRIGNNSGGIIMVAANSPKEASELLSHISSVLDYYSVDTGEWIELHGVYKEVIRNSNEDTPQLIAEDGYTQFKTKRIL